MRLLDQFKTLYFFNDKILHAQKEYKAIKRTKRTKSTKSIKTQPSKSTKCK